MGMIETRRLLEQLDLMVEGNDSSDLKKLYSYKHHIIPVTITLVVTRYLSGLVQIVLVQQ